MLDPAQLYHQCRSGSGADQAEAFERLGGLLYRLLVPRVGADPRLEGLADDAAQEALVTVWRELDAGRGPDEPASFVSWAIRIAVNKLLDMRRRLEPKGRARATKRVAISRQVRIDERDNDTGHDLADRLADPSDVGLDERTEREELHEAVMSIGVLDSVSDASKTVLLKGYVEGWSDEELAALLDTSRGNVHVIRCRDLQRLRGDDAFMERLRSATDGDA